MFSEFRYIDRAFRHIQLFTACYTIGLLGVSLCALGYAVHLVHRAQSRIYILEQGKVLQALAVDRSDNLGVEARDHIRVFHEEFFTLAPDEKVIHRNIGRALYMADGSAQQEYNLEVEQGNFRQIIAGNVTQAIEVDSIQVDLSRAPYRFFCWSTLTITRPSKVTLRSLVTRGDLRNVPRSDNDPHGFLIENWQILDSRDIKTTSRLPNQ